MEDLEGDDCGDYYDRDDEVDEVNGEDKETSSNEQYSDLDSQNNGSYICANLFISHVNPTSSHCGMVNVRMPLSSVPLSQKKNSVHVGKVVYSCFHALPSSVLNITSYTLPRYHDELTNTHTLPVNHEYVNNTWRHSNLSLNVHDGVLVYTFEARCNLTAEAVLCWKSQHRPACQELPHSRRNINAQVPQSILGIKLFHPSLCVQMQTGDQTLEQRVLNVFMSNECEKLWSPNSNEAFYVCSLDKYTRRRWHMALMLSVVIACTALLFLILMKMELKKCLKWISADKSLDEIFKGRRVWILYSPDSPVYEKLVSALAASLKELRLNVVLDQWHRVEMCQVLPMPWYYQQKALVFKENGIIILLFSEGSRERFDKWCNKDSPELSALDPYSSFGATLNCVYPDFLEGKAAGRYVIANFELFGKVDIPQIFQAVPTFSLPSQLHKLLKEITGANRSKLRNKQLQLLSDKLSDKLQKSIKECHSNRLQQSVSNQLGSETSVSMSYDESVSRTMQPLI
ncbi:interleukin-17 receptor C [Rhinophrynus dorsalis]